MAPNLHDAVWTGGVAEVSRLVAAGADVEEELGELGLRSLHVAAGYGQVEVLKVLVELGADKEAKMAAGMTPLHAAAFHGNVEAIKALAQLGADIATRMETGETSLEISVRLGHQRVAQVLREHRTRTAGGGQGACTAGG
jgi:ankyrin repeat protein